MADFVWRGTKEELFRRLAQLPLALAGRLPEAHKAAAVVSKAIGIEMTSCVRENFIEKGRGGGGVDSRPWKPLSPAYVAYGRRHAGLTQKRTRAGKAGRAGRPLLTAAQDKLWRAVYASCLRRGDDSSTAARKAWGAAKAAGGKTIIGQYGNAQVEIGRDRGILLASLSVGGSGNVLDAQPGSLKLGSTVPYARFFHAKRPIVPTDMPAVWQVRLGDVLGAAMPGFLKSFLGG